MFDNSPANPLHQNKNEELDIDRFVKVVADRIGAVPKVVVQSCQHDGSYEESTSNSICGKFMDVS